MNIKGKSLEQLRKEYREEMDQELASVLVSRGSSKGDVNYEISLLSDILDQLKQISVNTSQIQSTDSPDDPTPGVKSESQTVAFNDAAPGEEKMYNPITDSTFYSSYNASTELAEFLSRPVLIESITWAENSDLTFIFNPWENFFNDTVIKRKLDNFAFLSCNLKVKLMINASPFYYGIGLMSYLPLSSFEGANVAPASAEQLFGVNSQRPHVYFYPQSNQGGELTLPYINYRDWIEVTELTAFQGFGELTISTIGNLRNANSVAGTGVSIQIYAWAEDVKLTGNTLAVALQSQDTDDEYNDHNGVVSKPASAIAKAMGMLSDVPVIGPYATSASMIAGKIGTVASWFGFTNTPNINASEPFMGKPMHAFASPEISRPSNKLTIDPKNELTIDSRACGMDGEDHMMISNVIQREAFVFQTEWDSTATPNTQIFAIRVNPTIANVVSSVNEDIVQMTPLSLVSQMFKFWRGDIIYRFQFIASKYHRGRVRLTWDPVSTPTSTPTTSTTSYTKIIDISETPNFEIRIPYQQETAYKRIPPVADVLPIFIENDFPLLVGPGDNGVLNLRVFTELTSPVANAAALVNVSVRAADNFEFSAPDDVPKDIFVYPVQSQDVEICSTKPETFFDVVDDSNRNLVYQGEHITSLRQILRRSTISRIANQFTTSPVSYAKLQFKHPRLPYYPGFDPNGIHLAISPVDGLEKRYNYVANTPFTWIRHCYLANRGSIEWTQWLDNSSNVMPGFLGTRRLENGEQLSLSEAQRTAVIDFQAAPTFTGQYLEFSLENFGNSATGLDVTSPYTWASNHTIAPMYSEYRMLPNNPADASFGTDLVSTRDDGLETSYAWNEKNNGTLSVIYTRLFQATAIGPDFSFLYFINVPTMYKYSRPAPADNQPYA